MELHGVGSMALRWHSTNEDILTHMEAAVKRNEKEKFKKLTTAPSVS